VVRLLYVTGKNFGGGAVFVKQGGCWVMTDCAPYLKRVIWDTPIPDIGYLLTTKGFTYRWLKINKGELEYVEEKKS